MPFQKGQSGNPHGYKTKRQWIKEQERFREAKATWKKLLQLRDDLILERKQIGTDKDGLPIVADVVPSVKDYLNCCKQILDRAIGLPKQEVELKNENGEPFAFNVILKGNEIQSDEHQSGSGRFEFHYGSGNGQGG